jgi:hypothetical protein
MGSFIDLMNPNYFFFLLLLDLIDFLIKKLFKSFLAIS